MFSKTYCQILFFFMIFKCSLVQSLDWKPSVHAGNRRARADIYGIQQCPGTVPTTAAARPPPRAWPPADVGSPASTTQRSTATQLTGDNGVSPARVPCMWCLPRRGAGGGGALSTEFNLAEGIKVENPYINMLKIIAAWCEGRRTSCTSVLEADGSVSGLLFL